MLKKIKYSQINGSKDIDKILNCIICVSHDYLLYFKKSF